MWLGHSTAEAFLLWISLVKTGFCIVFLAPLSFENMPAQVPGAVDIVQVNSHIVLVTVLKFRGIQKNTACAICVVWTKATTPSPVMLRHGGHVLLGPSRVWVGPSWPQVVTAAPNHLPIGSAGRPVFSLHRAQHSVVTEFLNLF